MADFSLDSRFISPPPHFGLLGKKNIFLRAKNYQDLIKLRQENSSTCQDLIKVYQEIFVYQDLGKIIQVLQELTRWQGVSNFVRNFSALSCDKVIKCNKINGSIRSAVTIFQNKRRNLSIFLKRFVVIILFLISV